MNVAVTTLCVFLLAGGPGVTKSTSTLPGNEGARPSPEAKRPPGSDRDRHPERTPLFADLTFRRGFHLSYPTTAQGRRAAAILPGHATDDKPVWRLCQWGTRHSLAGAPRRLLRGGDLSFENDAKRVVVGSPASERRDLILEIRGRPEYGTRPRKRGESWPHLLVEQDALTVIPLSDLREVGLRVRLRLLAAKSHMGEAFDANLHTAQFQLFLIVKNINPASPDYRDFIWFGVPFYDWRHDISPPHMAKDGGKKDATGKFIYTIDGREVVSRPLKDRTWVDIKKNLLPRIEDGLREAVRRKFLEGADPKDYAAVNVNLGWELPGTFDVAMQVRGLDLYLVRKIEK